MNPHPSMMTIHGLLAPVCRAENRLREAWNAASSSSTHIIIDHGLFALMISTFEVMLGDCLRYYLINNPDQLEFKDDRFDDDDFLLNDLVSDLIKIKVERKIRKLMYGTLNDCIRHFLRTLGIDSTPLSGATTDSIARIIEAKATRNLLLHNDLIVNGDYESSAGQYRRSPVTSFRSGNIPRLEIPSTYLHETHENLTVVVQELKKRLEHTYKNKTRLAFFEELWSHLVNARFTPFHDFWQTDQAEDKIVGIKFSDREPQMGGAERIFLSLWRSNVSGNDDAQSPLTLSKLDSESKRKLHYLIRISAEFGLS